MKLEVEIAENSEHTSPLYFLLVHHSTHSHHQTTGRICTGEGGARIQISVDPSRREDMERDKRGPFAPAAYAPLDLATRIEQQREWSEFKIMVASTQALFELGRLWTGRPEENGLLVAHFARNGTVVHVQR